MPTYISLINWTQQGMEHIKEGPARLDRAKQATQALGGEFIAFYLVLGRYDAVFIANMPDDEAVARLSLMIGSAGNVRTETLKAFTEKEFRQIVAGLP